MFALGDGSGDPPRDEWPRSVRDRLFDQRVVFVSGTLDGPVSSQAAMELMTLDASGDEPIQLQIECSDGDVDSALCLMDVIELAGVPVRATALGLVGGPAVGVLAVAHHRAATLHSRLALFEPSASFSGPGRDVESWAEHRLVRWQLFCERVAVAVKREYESVAADFGAGRFLGAQEALDYGLLDEISRPDARLVSLRGRPMGFGSTR